MQARDRVGGERRWECRRVSGCCLHGDARVLGAQHRRRRVEVAHVRLELHEVARLEAVDLVDQQAVGGGDLRTQCTTRLTCSARAHAVHGLCKRK